MWEREAERERVRCVTNVEHLKNVPKSLARKSQGKMILHSGRTCINLRKRISTVYFSKIMYDDVDCIQIADGSVQERRCCKYEKQLLCSKEKGHICIKQGRQCTYNVILRRHSETIVVGKHTLKVYVSLHETPWRRVFPEKLTHPKLLKKFPAFYVEHDALSPYSQQPAICPYPEPDRSGVCPPIQPLKDPL
jgi:hypothetical protein